MVGVENPQMVGFSQSGDRIAYLHPVFKKCQDLDDLKGQLFGSLFLLVLVLLISPGVLN